MSKGTLRIQTFASRYSAPIPHATVVITAGDFFQQVVTDSEGNAPIIEIDAPDVQYSLDKNNETILPYATCNITAFKEGYRTVTIQQVQVFACQLTLAPLQMVIATDDILPILETPTVIPVHSLFSGDSGSAPAPIDDGLDTRVLQNVIIPTNVIVHLGKPSATARDVTVSFRDYIANVASSEVYPTWPEQSLRANIHCQISIVLNRVYTEWYPSKGYDYTITNSTSYDQYFVEGRTPFEIMETLTDDIFNTYIRQTGTVNPYYSEYCDGKSVSCPGLKQWGTVDLADEGKNALEILKFYYGDDIEIVRTNNIQSIPESYPGTPLQEGDTGTAVYTLQRQLNRIAKDYPAFGTQTTDGIFGASLKSSVQKFQSQFNLTADGIVGRQTWYKISYIYVSVKDLAELTSEGETESGGDLSPGDWGGTVLRVGSSGAAVEQVQFWLDTVARYYSDLTAPSVDGVFGTGTQNAVIAFQNKFGLVADGVVGENTWNKLYEEYEDILNDNGTANAYPGTPIRNGDSGDDVKQIQFWLRIAKTNYSALNNLSVDGIFGNGTQSAVEAFQRYFGLTDDGVVGALTWDKLYSVYVDITNDLLSPNSRPGDFPGTLREGSTGTAVKELQYYLFIMAAYEPSIPTLSIDGNFGAGTESSVIAFQRFAGLVADGIVGTATWTALYDAAARLRLSGPTRSIINLAYPGQELKKGDIGDNVEYFAVLLRRIAFYYDSVFKPSKSIFFDVDLENATKSFQELVSLEQTGVVDELTWNAANDIGLALLANADPAAEVDTNDEYPGFGLSKTSAGAMVRKVQGWINEYAKLYFGETFIEETGVYSEIEEAIIATIQYLAGLSPHGAVDRETWNVLRVRARGGNNG